MLHSIHFVEHHSDIITRLIAEIDVTFTSVGGVTPSINDLYDSSNWRYCDTVERKHKGKIGYLCSHLMAGSRPRVRIVVHNFAQGGLSATFDSWVCDKENREPRQLPYLPRVNRTSQTDMLARQQREQDEITRKHKRFTERLAAWKAGSPCIGDHPYVIRKGITEYAQLRWVDSQRVGFPLINLDGDVTGIQLIDHQGGKLIYGKKKGSFAALGDLDTAIRVYVCEGYATANAVFELVKASQKRPVPYAVIVALDAKNLETVVSLLSQRYKHKKITVCPDNDADKVPLGKHNVGLLSGYHAALCAYTEIKIPPASDTQGQDWCDVYLRDPDTAIEAFSAKRPIHIFDYATARLQSFGHGDTSVALKKACVAALHLGAKKYPAHVSEQDLLNTLQDKTAHTGITPATVKGWWTKIKRRQFAMALRAKSLSKAQAEHVNIVTVDSLHAAHEHVQVLKKQHPKAIFITNAPMGLGKTKDFIQPAFMAADACGEIPVVITPTKALTQGVSERFGASHYLGDSEEGTAPHSSLFKHGMIPDALAITINSIISPRFQDVLSFSQTLFIDEYTQVLRAITAGTVESHLKHATEAKLATLIQQSRYTYIADADFNQIALEQLNAIIGERPVFIFKVVETDHATSSIVEQKNSDTEKRKRAAQPVIYRYYRDKDGHFPPKYAFTQIEAAAKAGKTLYVASDSKTQLDTLNDALQAQEIDVLLVHADNTGFTAQRAFLDNPDRYLKQHQPQVVLVSPCVQSGISIEVDYFEQCFGLYTGTVAPVVFQQMLHRVRAQRLFHLALPSRKGTSNKDTENATALLLGAYAQHIQQSGGIAKVAYDPESQTHCIGHIKVSDAAGQLTLEGDPAYQRYETLCAQLQALDNQQAHNAANIFCLQAMARGVVIEPVDIQLKTQEKAQIKQNHQYHKMQQKALKTLRILKADVIDEHRYQHKTQAGNATSQHDYNEISRYEIAKELSKPSVALNSDDIDFYDNSGCVNVANYQALLQGKEKAKHNDVVDAEKGVAKTNAKWRESKVSLLTLLFKKLGLDVNTGSGHYTQKEAKAVRDAIKDDDALTRYLTFKLSLNVDNHLADTAFVNKILKKLLGLKMQRFLVRDEKVRYWVYTLDSQGMKTLTYYHRLKFQYTISQEDLSSENII